MEKFNEDEREYAEYYMEFGDGGDESFDKDSPFCFKICKESMKEDFDFLSMPMYALDKEITETYNSLKSKYLNENIPMKYELSIINLQQNLMKLVNFEGVPILIKNRTIYFPDSELEYYLKTHKTEKNSHILYTFKVFKTKKEKILIYEEYSYNNEPLRSSYEVFEDIEFLLYKIKEFSIDEKKILYKNLNKLESITLDI